ASFTAPRGTVTRSRRKRCMRAGVEVCTPRPGRIAQLVEHRLHTAGVTSSSLVASTPESPLVQRAFFVSGSDPGGPSPLTPSRAPPGTPVLGAPTDDAADDAADEVVDDAADEVVGDRGADDGVTGSKSTTSSTVTCPQGPSAASTRATRASLPMRSETSQ